MKHYLRPKLAAFTLVELLAVVIIIAIITIIAIPYLTDFREKAYGTAIRADLKNLITAEGIFYSDLLTYTDSVEDLQLVASDNVTLTIHTANQYGYSATSSHSALDEICQVYVGEADTPEACSPTIQGVITCCIPPSE